MKKLAFLFPGQGAQYVGMSKKLCSLFPEAKNTFDEANDVLGFDLENLCFSGDKNELMLTENTQPAILTASVAAYRVYMKEIGVNAAVSAGHSLGEISALCCADALSFADALKFVRLRGKLMSKAVPAGKGAMAAVSGTSPKTIKEECEKASHDGKIVVPANFNSPNQIVVSGNSEAVAEVSEKLKRRGAVIIPLRVSGPFHSPLMKPAAEKLRAEIEKISFKAPSRAVIANFTAAPYSAENIKDNLINQVTHPVRWIETMNLLREENIDMAVEFGPKKVLQGLMKSNIPTLETLSYDAETDMEEVKDILKSTENSDIDGMELLKMCICNAVCTQNSNWNEEEYKKGVEESYKTLVNLRDTLTRSKKTPDTHDLKEGITLLKTIFDTKKVPKAEQQERFSEIFAKTGAKDTFEKLVG